MDTFDPHRLMEKFTSLVGEAEIVRKNMRASLEECRGRGAAQFDHLFPSTSLEKREAFSDRESLLRAGTALR
jgi:hypothetical protein